MSTFSNFNLFKNLNQVLEELSKHESIKPVQQLLQVYNEAKINCDKQKEEAKYPLIVLEGLDGSGKTSMTKKLAKKCHAERWLTPPESVRFLRDYFDGNPALRTAYYSLGNYIAALEVSCILHEQPVVMDRFWHSTTAYTLAQSVADNSERLTLPDRSDEVYKWPDDLLKPNQVILLDVSEEIRLERHARRGEDLVTEQERLLKKNDTFRQNVIQAYKNMREPGVTFVTGNESFCKTVQLLYDTVKPLLN